MSSNMKKLGSYVLAATALSGCIIVRVPPPARNDPFQPPAAAPITIQKGATHRLRLTCGAQANFRPAMGAVDNLGINYEGENLTQVNQSPSTPVRLTWAGPSAAWDIPFNVGSQNTRKAMGNITVNAPPGAHTFTVAMPNGPDCGPTNVTIVFR